MKQMIAVLLFSTSLLACKKPATETSVKLFSREQMQAGANYSLQKGGTAVLFMQNGQVVYENYHNGADANTATHIQSGTKGFFAAVVALAIQEGYISGYEENVSETITEWQSTTLHPGKRLIKIKDLVSLTSGLSQNISDIQGANASAPDIYKYTVDSLSLISVPGTHFQYGPSHYYAFGVFLKRKMQRAGINQDPLQYLETRILQKIGITYSSWIYDQAGNPHIPNGCYITPRNWVKFGQFLLQKGSWNNAQIIQKSLVEALFVPKADNPGYGSFLWLNNPNGETSLSGQHPAPAGSAGGLIYYGGYTDMIGALGAGKNRLYIIPSLNAIIVRQTLDDTSDFSDNDFLSLVLPK